MTAGINLIYSTGTLFFNGVLTMDTVPEAENQFSALKSKLSVNLDINLQDLEVVDSAGLAMLINVKAHFEKADSGSNGSQINFLNAPGSLKKLSKLSDADKLLQI